MIGEASGAGDGGVGRFYEEHPYPDHGVVSAVVARMLKPLLRDVQRERGGSRVRVVDVGCGTGEQACGVARAFPEVEVVGIDRNAASVVRARKLAAKHNLPVTFEQGDLLGDISALGNADVILLIGVLHHLPDPAAALATLAHATTAGTMLLAMMYGRFGHAHRLRVREALELLAGNATRENRLAILREGGLANNTSIAHHLDTLSHRVRFGPDISPIEALRRVLAGRSSAYQADCYTHPLEATYTWTELAELLDRGGWEFVGWPKRSGMPDRPEQVARGPAVELLESMSRIDQASVYERLIAPFLLYLIGRRSV